MEIIAKLRNVHMSHKETIGNEIEWTGEQIVLGRKKNIYQWLKPISRKWMKIKISHANMRHK